jgi:hypothetical protein
MQRRRLLLLVPLVTQEFFVSRYLRALVPKRSQPVVDYQAQALKLNQLATNIRTIVDARMLVDFITSIFSDHLQPAWSDSRIRGQIAEAEFAAVSEPNRLIPEHRLAETWNNYAQTIQAPLSCQVTAAEIHNLRDSLFTSARLLWGKGSRNIWSAPSIYATQADGSMATGCRAIESIRILWDIANMPENLASARVRVSHGIFASELFSQALEHPSTTTHKSYVTSGPGTRNPVEVAEREYVAGKGTKAFSKALQTMLNQALA